MAGLVLMLMVAVMVVVLLYRRVRQKPIKKLLLSYSIVLGSYLMIVSCTCGPNPKDVAVMKPMAEKIASYIETHGIPESLKDIPGLPYVLEGCERSEEYWKRSNIGIPVKVDMQNATKIDIQETCKYKTLGRNYEANMEINDNIKNDNYDSILLKIFNRTSKTGIDYLFDFNTTNNYWRLANRPGENFKNVVIYSSKTSGICNPMRQ